MIVVSAPAISSARGMFLRAFSISSPSIDALSRPLSENAIVDQKMMSLRCVLGTNDFAVNGVADPKSDADAIPMPTSTIAGIQSPSAPRLCSHFPMLSPRMLSPTATPSAINEKMMKYGWLFCSASKRCPKMKSAFAAVK